MLVFLLRPKKRLVCTVLKLLTSASMFLTVTLRPLSSSLVFLRKRATATATAAITGRAAPAAIAKPDIAEPAVPIMPTPVPKALAPPARPPVIVAPIPAPKEPVNMPPIPRAVVPAAARLLPTPTIPAPIPPILAPIPVPIALPTPALAAVPATEPVAPRLIRILFLAAVAIICANMFWKDLKIELAKDLKSVRPRAKKSPKASATSFTIGRLLANSSLRRSISIE